MSVSLCILPAGTKCSPLAVLHLRCRAGARGRGVCKQKHPQRDGELSESPYQQGWKCKMSWGQPESLPWAPAASTIPSSTLGLVKAIKTKCDCSSSALGISASHGAGESALKWFQAALACCGLQKGGGMCPCPALTTCTSASRPIPHSPGLTAAASPATKHLWCVFFSLI